MLFMLTGSAIGVIIDWLGNILGYIGDIAKFLVYLALWQPLFILSITFMAIVTFAQEAFLSLSGVNSIYLNGVEFSGAKGNGQDLVYAFITEPAVQDVFFSILALSFVLLFILTIVALVKAEFTIDTKGSAKGPIIGRALKSLANFIVIPVTAILAILGTNFLTKTIYNIFETDSNYSIAGKCLMLGLYNANNARLSKGYAENLSKGLGINSDKNPFEGKSQSEIAALIDKCFSGGQKVEIKFDSSDSGKWSYVANLEEGYFNIGAIFGYPNDTTVGLHGIDSVFFYYNVFKFDLILMLGSLMAMSWILLSTCLVLVKRVFELTILFLLAPPMIAIAPLDGGQAEKKWRQEFMKRLLCVIGPIFAFNMYFLFVPLFENIQLFTALDVYNEGKEIVKDIISCISSGSIGSVNMLGVIPVLVAFYAIFDIFFQVICIIVGMSIVKSASALLSNLLGVDDLVKAGGEAANKAIQTGVAVASLATGVGSFAAHGTAALMKGRGLIGGKAGRLEYKENKAKKKLDKAIKSGDKEKIAKSQEKYNKAVENRNDYVGEAGKRARAFDEGRLKAKKEYQDASAEFDEGNWDEAHQKRDPDGYKAAMAKFKAKEYIYNGKYGGDDDVEMNKKRDAVIGDVSEKERKRIDQASRASIMYSGVDSIKTANKTEFGKDAKDRSYFSSMFEKGGFTAKLTKILPIGGTATLDSLKNLFNADNSKTGGTKYDNTNWRRIMDGMSRSLGGDQSGASTLWKTLFNKNARANLYEGVPEAKNRENDIQQSVLMAARDRYEEGKKKELKEKENTELMKRMVAGENEEVKLARQDLTSRKEQAEMAGDTLAVKKLEAEIMKFDDSHGITSKVKSMDIQDANTRKKLDEEKDKLANENAYKKAEAEQKAAAKEQAAKDLTERKVKGEVSLKNPEQIGKKMGEGVAQASKQAKMNVKLDTTSLGDLLSGFGEQLTKIIEESFKSAGGGPGTPGGTP